RELDDKEALDYLDQITLPHRLGYEEMSHRITKGYGQMNPRNVERLMNLINTWNCNMNSYIKHLYWHDGQISFVDRNGSNQRLELANEELQSVICNMVTLAAIVHDKSEDEITKVVLFDNVKWIPNEYRPDPIELIKALSDKHGIQFITIEEIPRVSKIIKQSIIR
ncbi:MAG: hypothetical protein OR994_08355, partial [Candidatus Poseidoniales archaeon]|nr:hypothetical protein [Candidatus Poseidoniales archaeon]